MREGLATLVLSLLLAGCGAAEVEQLRSDLRESEKRNASLKSELEAARGEIAALRDTPRQLLQDGEAALKNADLTLAAAKAQRATELAVVPGEKFAAAHFAKRVEAEEAKEADIRRREEEARLAVAGASASITKNVSVTWTLYSASGPPDSGKRVIPVRGRKGCLSHWDLQRLSWRADARDRSRIEGALAGEPFTDLSVVVRKGRGMPGVPALEPGVLHPTLIVRPRGRSETVIRLYPERRGGEPFAFDTVIPTSWDEVELACD